MNRSRANRCIRSPVIHNATIGASINPMVPTTCAIADNGSAKPSYRPGRTGRSVHTLMSAVAAQAIRFFVVEHWMTLFIVSRCNAMLYLAERERSERYGDTI
jgi:hypothetical protein